MAIRNVPLVSGQFYHVYNRGNEKRSIYLQTRDFNRFIQTLYYYQYKDPRVSFSKFSKFHVKNFGPLNETKLVNIICYCLMPNHFHLLIQQLEENGITLFMGKLSNSYTKYFNIKYDRVGHLFQDVFKSVLVESDEQLIHLSRYIHLNPVVSGLVKNPQQYRWSSYSYFMNKDNSFCATNQVLEMFPSCEAYQEFILDQIEYVSSLELIKHSTFDEEF